MPDLLRDQLQRSLGSAYTLGRELGGGGMSHVFLAEDAQLGRHVVVKVLPREMAGAVNVERFRREIATAARLQHPHIVPVLSAGEMDGLPFFTMPFVDGESLRARLERGRLEVTQAVAILRDVARALAYAHAHGVVHRDVKPENVLLSGGAAAVSDFGVAKALQTATHGDAAGPATRGGLTGLGVALGTPTYMSPEQAAADPAVDARSDLYSWGIVAYELLAGRPPFAGRSPSATMAAHVSELPEPLARVRPDAPPALASLVMRCLAKRPDDRPPSAQAVLDALDALTTPGGGSAAARPPRARAPRLAVLAALVLLGGVAGALAYGRRASPAAAEGTGRRVVVAPLENLTGDPSLDHVGRIAADWLTQGIAQTESVTVVSSAAAAMAIDGARGSYAQLVQRLVTTTGATHLVSGSVVRRGDSLQLQVQLTDSRTGRLLRTIDPAIGPTRDPIEAIDALRERVMGALAAEQRTGDSTALLTVRAPKYSAYREFVEGAERFRRFQDYGAAIPRFERAVALDSTFAVAWQYLAVSHVNLGEYAAADTLLPRIEALRDRLGPSERDMLEWQRASLKGDWDEALRRAQVMSARDSSPIGLYLVGLHANRLLRPRLAVPALLAADARMAIGGWVPQIGVLAESYHQLGRHDDELATLARGRRLYPTNRALLARGLRAYAALRRPDAALALADTVLRTASDSLGADVARVLTGAAEFRAHGDSATARRLAELAVTWHAANRPRAVGPVRAERAGMAFLQAGRPDSAERHLALAARDTACCAVAYLAALRFERGGDTAALLRVADSLGADARKWTFGQNRFAQAGLLARVDRERAMAALRAAVREGYTMQSLHYAPLLAPLRGLPAFEALVTPQR